MKSSKDFENILREKLVPYLIRRNYKLTYDNSQLEENEKSSKVFKLIFKGENIIEVSNDDWRDYTEYFHFYLNKKLLFTANINNYSDIQDCYFRCEKTLKINVGLPNRS